MSPANPFQTFEENWGRRAAVLIVVGGLVTAATLLYLGFETEARQAGLSPGDSLLYPEFLEQCFESLMRRADYDPSFRPLPIPAARKQQLKKAFKDGPLYDKLFQDTVHWFEEERGLARVNENDLDERISVINYLNRQFLEVSDAAFIANLGKTPEGRFFLQAVLPDGLSEDRSSIIIDYAIILCNYRCFHNVNVNFAQFSTGEAPHDADHVAPRLAPGSAAQP
jgi:hypothetical protein